MTHWPRSGRSKRWPDLDRLGHPRFRVGTWADHDPCSRTVSRPQTVTHLREVVLTHHGVSPRNSAGLACVPVAASFDAGTTDGSCTAQRHTRPMTGRTDHLRCPCAAYPIASRPSRVHFARLEPWLSWPGTRWPLPACAGGSDAAPVLGSTDLNVPAPLGDRTSKQNDLLTWAFTVAPLVKGTRNQSN